jgi:cytochrome bd-type quinol oxidase subunit 2
MQILNKIKKYYPFVIILQLPLILGFALPIAFYSNFFYVDDVIENSFVELAKKNYLIIIIISNLFCFFLISIIPTKKNAHNKYIPSFFLIKILSLISAFSTLLSRFFVFEFYYFNLIFYIAQHIVLILLLLSSLFSYQKK